MIRNSIYTIVFLMLVIGGWVIGNPSKGFGLSIYAITTFDKIPYIYSDIEVSVSGKVRKVEKTHLIEKDQLNNLLSENPEILILSTGWDGSIMEVKNIRRNESYKLIIKKNQEAKKLYNQFKKEGKKVAIRYHSTC